MEECCLNGEASISLEEFQRWDSLLHEVIADSAHNAFITKEVRLMNDASGIRQNHRSLVADLKNRDVVHAKELGSANLLHVRSSMLGY